MSIQSMKETVFPIPSLQQWVTEVERTLKGKSAASLQTKTEEGIIIKPLYTKEDVTEQAVRYIRQGETVDWHVTQWQRTKEEVAEAIERGLTMAYVTDETLLSSLQLPVFCQSEQPIDVAKYGHIEGVLAYDPIAKWARDGSLSQPIERALKQHMMAVKQPTAAKTLVIDGRVYEQAGADAVTQVATILAVAVDYVERALASGLTMDEVAAKLAVQVNVGKQFFMEVAKIRALRWVWAQMMAEYGGPTTLWLHAETSPYTKTTFDPNVNLLRTTTEAFSAVVGGVDSLFIAPFIDSPLGRRIAQNTHFMLKEEAYLQHVLDPAGGSYYVESLTTEVATKSWAKFQMMMASGGILKALNSGELQADITRTHAAKVKKVATRQTKVVGTNVYANLQESVTPLATMTVTNSEVTPLGASRLTEPFEQLRLAAEAAVERPTVYLVNIGTLADYKARMDFITGFFEAGGICVVKSDGMTTRDDVERFVATTNGMVYCLCAQDDDYATYAVELLPALKENIVYMAGAQGEEAAGAYKAAGVHDFIHVRSNCYDVIATVLQQVGVLQ